VCGKAQAGLGCSGWIRSGNGTPSFLPIGFLWRRCATSGALYLNPLDNAVVPCVDEKSQIQALERTPGRCHPSRGTWKVVTHDYRRMWVA
jgi:hypothetical protein